MKELLALLPTIEAVLAKISKGSLAALTASYPGSTTPQLFHLAFRALA